MSQKIVTECDYRTQQGLHCRKREGTAGVVVKLFAVDKDGNVDESPYAVYTKDVCPKHERMGQRKIASVYGDPVSVLLPGSDDQTDLGGAPDTLQP